MRIDNYLVEKKYFSSRTKAQQAISRGEVFVDNKLVIKSSDLILGDPIISIVFEKNFVSLGGFKLQKAFDDFNFLPTNMIVADIGASTGGFTDCLLQNGAKLVYSVDLNDDLLSPLLKNNVSVKPIIKNAKDLNKADFDNDLDLITADLSFISASHVLPVFSNLLKNEKYLILLIKPQFEMDERRKFKNGIIRDNKLHVEVCKKIIDLSIAYNLFPVDITTAPLHQDKNKEFLILLKKGVKSNFNIENKL